jgi:type III pantothenate kinase
MILTLDIGNSQIYAGVFDAQGELAFTFRKSSKSATSSDEIGVFLKSVLRENDVDPTSIRKIAICSVVPDLNHTVASCCVKYFGLNPFILQAGVKTGLSVKYRNPVEVGSDRIANAIAATKLYPNKNLVIIDYGTATTFCAVSKSKEYLGGVIMPGLRLMMESLEANTSKLPAVSIVRAKNVVAKSTVEGIQAGLYLTTFSATKYITDEIRKNYFANEDTVIIGTGGFARLYENEKLFDTFLPELVLKGLYYALEMNA